MEWWAWIDRLSYSVSGIQDYIEYIIKKHKIVIKISLFYVHINRINNKLVFKINYGYKLDYKRLKQWNYFVAQKSK